MAFAGASAEAVGSPEITINENGLLVAAQRLGRFQPGETERMALTPCRVDEDCPRGQTCILDRNLCN